MVPKLADDLYWPGNLKKKKKKIPGPHPWLVNQTLYQHLAYIYQLLYQRCNMYLVYWILNKWHMNLSRACWEDKRFRFFKTLSALRSVQHCNANLFFPAKWYKNEHWKSFSKHAQKRFVWKWTGPPAQCQMGSTKLQRNVLIRALTKAVIKKCTLMVNGLRTDMNKTLWVKNRLFC